MSSATEAEPGPAPKKKKRLLPLCLLFVVLAGAGAGGAWYMGYLPGMGSAEASTHEAAEEHPEPKKSLYVDMPDMIVNLAADDRRLHFMKAKFAFEVGGEEDKAAIEAMSPKILDAAQLYLRALKVDEVSGSEGMQRLKDELRARVNLIVAPVEVEDVLFKELLVQ